MATPEARLAELGIELPSAPPPAAAYVPVVRSGDLLYTAGQVATAGGRMPASGKLGARLDLEAGVEAAQRCAVNVLAQLKAALGDLGRVERVVKITVFVASTPEFTDQHLVADGASGLLGHVLGDAGVHARSAVGVASLPMDSPVEVEAVVAVVG